MKTAVLFGGSGFIGTFFTKHLIEIEGFSKVYIFDLERIEDKNFKYRENIISTLNGVKFIKGDVREEIKWMPAHHIDLVINLAAIHREPGHELFEYYETNILGAENICNWVQKINCKNIIFTSSIAPYGSHQNRTNEKTLTLPETPYGGSKLVAEKIHEIWFSKSSDHQLLILRPGVVFGPTEGGNVSRLIKAVKGNYFMYTGNKDTKKSGIYVKELCIAAMWILNKESNKNSLIIANLCMKNPPSVKDYIENIADLNKKNKSFLNIPISMLVLVAYIIELILKPFKISHPFSPVRVKKLTKSNNIIPKYLIDNQYDYKYSLKDALKDWKKSNPDEWN